MLNVLGAVLILFASTMFGFRQSLQLSRRPKQIRELIQALQRLETEIVYGFTPLSDALQSAGRPFSPAIAALFQEAAGRLESDQGRTAEECWARAVETVWADTSMKTGEREVLERLGCSLGISDRDDQQKHIRLAVTHLQAEEQKASTAQQKYAGMWKSLGLLAGALIVIIMV
ncbi:stage III sporulation protein SpoIIIAB [Paenibacillus senegalensis]|uniref:stage III sporulation protein SpoIIIAB n=1 Tax=Paenibacillus senegalensis TaxID=1465766 RepID=UPI000287A70B|nr:stage III sporulation protein SpoIIIAB [Paenibacillus senegalensis]